MQKKLTEEQQKALLENAISEFGERGLAAATVSSIAERSGISVGVIYKYYENKEALFEACLDASVSLLGDVLRSSVTKENSLEESVRGLIRASQNLARSIRRISECIMPSPCVRMRKALPAMRNASSGFPRKFIRN